MFIDKKSPVPVYYQLRNLVMRRIEAGEFPPDSPIPSERDLSETLGISRMTVRQALNRLVVEGVLYREKGRGTFVSRQKIEQRNVMSFSDLVKSKGLEPSTRVLSLSRLEADHETAQTLGLKDSDILFNIKRLRLAGSVPVAIEEVFIPEKFCPGLDQMDLTGSLYRLLKEEYAFNISYVDNVIEASKPLKEERDLFDLPSGVPALRISSVYFTESGTRLFSEKSTYRSDEYKYNVRVYVNKDME